MQSSASTETPPPPRDALIALLDRWIPRVAVGVIALLGGALTLRRFHDFDLLWHVRTGEWILAHASIPLNDPFGAVTAGAPWIDVAWGSQVIMAAVAHAVGLSGLHLLAVAIVVVTLAVLLTRGPLTPLVATAAFVFVLVAWFRFLVRPDLLTLPLTAVLLFLVDRLPVVPRATLVAVTLLTVAWANLHGSFVLAPIVFGAAAAGALVGKRTRGRFRLYAAALGLALIAPLVNPYGWRLFEIFEPYLRSWMPGAPSLAISEWSPTWQALTAPGGAYSPALLVVLLALPAVSFVLRKTALDFPLLFGCLALAALGWLSIRNLLPLATAALTVIVIHSRERPGDPGPLGRWARRLDSQTLGTFVATGVILAGTWAGLTVVTDRFYVGRDLPYRTGVAVDADLVPEGAARWLAAHEHSGIAFNNFDSGSYLLYRLYPDFRPYVDPRVIDEEHVIETRRVVADPATFDRWVAEDDIGIVVLAHPSFESRVLLPRLARDGRWTLVFRDHNSTVHARSDLPRPAASTGRLPPGPWVEPAAVAINRGLESLKRERLPVADLTDAFVSALLGDPAREREAYLRAKKIAPANPRVRAYFEIRKR